MSKFNSAEINEQQQWWDTLNRHDWYYHFSDDGRVWRAGEAATAKLESEARVEPWKQTMYEAFAKHMFSGDAWNTEQAPKPERPQ